VRDYLIGGPGFVFLHHPALGPLWQVMGQKIRSGSLAPHSEVQLEVAEACLREVHVAGSLLVHADAALGHTEQQLVPSSGGGPSSGSGGSQSSSKSSSSLLDSLLSAGAPSSVNGSSMSGSSTNSGGGYSQPCNPPACAQAAESRLVFSQRCGRLRLHNVRVANRGADWEHPDNVWWRHSLARHESCRITLRGMSGEAGGACTGPAAGASGCCCCFICRQLACLLAGWVLALNSHLPTPPACLRAEFEARDVTLAGDLAFEVPDGHRMLVTAGADGALHTQLLPLGTPTWQWQYSMTPGGEVQLELLEGSASAVSAGSSASASA
jgi:hypothetical protein